VKAFLLAAGRARRLYPLTKDIPKCLLRVGSRTLLERQVELLKAVGIDDVTVVTGHRAERIHEVMGRTVKYIYNPYFAVTADIVSLWCLRKLMRGAFLYLHSDILFSRGILEQLLGGSGGDMCLVVDPKPCDAEDEKVRVVGNLIVEIGKTIPLGKECGEFIGIARVSDGAAPRLREALEFLIDDGQIEVQCTEAIQRLIDQGGRVEMCTVKGVPWMEIDFYRDFEEAVQNAHLFG